MDTPQNLQLIGSEIAIAWSDGTEDYLPADFLRAQSPSAENKGERDIFGRKYGGKSGKDYSGVEITGWDWIGNYAVCFRFSDGHNSGIYSFDYLKKLGLLQRESGQ